MDYDMNKRRRIIARKNELFRERDNGWMSEWRNVSAYQQPRLGRFLSTETNRGGRRANNIYDSTAQRCADILAAGMMSGTTSPARPWLKLSLSDKDLESYAPVKVWLHKFTALLLRIFAESNTYNALHMGYKEIGLFGTWADVVLDDYDNVIHHQPLTIGEYALGTDYKGNVNSMAREYRMTVMQCVLQFGLDRVSDTVREMWRRCNYDAWVDVVHLVQPRIERNADIKNAQNMRFESVYIEPGKDDWDKYLRESGFDRFPVLAPRWDVTSNDIYGDSPGMKVQGDVQQLQHQQLRKSQTIDYQTLPPLQAPFAVQANPGSRLPGSITYFDSTGPHNSIRSMWDVQTNLQHLLLDIEDVRKRIKEGYYSDLFLMLAQDTTGTMTATEVAERHEEKLLMLGPVLERMHNECQGPLIDTVIDRCFEAGIAPPPPPEVKPGMELGVEFVSVFAQAQKIVGGRPLDRMIGTIGQIAAAKGDPGVWDKIDIDRVVDDYADMYGVNPAIIVDTDQAQAARDARNKQAQALAMAEAAPKVAQAAKAAGETDMEGVSDVMGGLTGYNTPSPQFVQ